MILLYKYKLLFSGSFVAINSHEIAGSFYLAEIVLTGYINIAIETKKLSDVRVQSYLAQYGPCRMHKLVKNDTRVQVH